MKPERLRYQASGILVGYGLQFLAGMLLNLFVTLPSTHPGSSGSNYFARSAHSLAWALSGHGGWELAFHVYLALLLVLGSVSLFIIALVAHDKKWAIVGGIALIFTLGAFFNGLSFVDYKHNVSSMIMASSWLVAVAALVYGLVTFNPTKPPAKVATKSV